MPNRLFVLAIATVVIVLVLRLLRSRTLREKYAALWLVVGLGTAVLVVFPRLLDIASAAVGISVPSNLLFFISILLLLAVSLQLSREISVLEDETRVLAEEAAMQRLTAEQLQSRVEAIESALRTPSRSSVRSHDPHDASVEASQTG